MAKIVDSTTDEAEGSDSPTPNQLAKHPDKPLKLVKFGADWCGHCVAMEKSQVLQKLAARHSDVELIIVDVDKNDEMADEYEVQAMPKIFFEDLEGYIVGEHEGGITEAQLEKLYAKANANVGAK